MDSLVEDNGLLSLPANSIETDYAQLKRLVESGAAVENLEDFYSGEFLSGLEHDGEQFMDWLRSMRNSACEMAHQILESSAQRHLKQGKSRIAINLLRDCLSLEPLKEQTHRKIMELYAAGGERAMALAQFRTCKELLLHELGAEPDPETVALADKIATRSEEALQIFHHSPESASVRSNDKKEPEAIWASFEAKDIFPSIAILPFVNMSGDAEQSYFTDGIIALPARNGPRMTALSPERTLHILKGTPACRVLTPNHERKRNSNPCDGIELGDVSRRRQ